jgi:hypothetical protein
MIAKKHILENTKTKRKFIHVVLSQVLVPFLAINHTWENTFKHFQR